MFGKPRNNLKVVIQKRKDKPLVLRDIPPREFTVGPSMDCSYTLDSKFLSDSHRLLKRRHGRTFLMVPVGISCELVGDNAQKRAHIELLSDLGLIEKSDGCFAVPFEEGTRAILKFGDVALGVEYVSPIVRKDSKESLPWVLRSSPYSKSDLIYFVILFLTFFTTFTSMWSINRIVFPEKEKDLNLELRQVEYLLKAPIQARELFEEPVKELEKEKLKEKTPPKKTSQNLKNKGLLGQLEKQKNFQGVLEMKELDNVLQGVGVLTAKRPQGYKSTGPQIAYRSASNMDDMVAGISKRSGGDVGGSQKRNVAVSNPFDVSGSGAQHELRSYQEIDRIIRRHLQGIRYLYERYLRSEPLLRGRVELVFTISAQGAVTDCQVKSSSMNHPSFEQELLRRVKLWKFPAIDPSGGNVRVVYPFSFIPKGD